jgi:proline iminopeptidase
MTATAPPQTRRPLRPRPRPRRSPRLLQHLWGDRRRALAAALGVPLVAGVLVGMVMPRGPVTSAQALTVIVLGILVGFTAGLVLRSRWAMLLSPVVHVATFELVRLGAEGPTVDRIGFTGMALMALLLGRGVHGLLGLLPMVLAGAYGAALARRLTGQPEPDGTAARTFRYLRRVVTALASAGVLLLAVAVAWPASTPPITGPEGDPLPGSIAELTTVELGGVEQPILLRGHSIDAPVLLVLHGGPGGSSLGVTPVLLAELEEHFVVVGWDQPGAGTSYPLLEPTQDLTVERMLSDTLELTDHLRARFDEERIYVLGESWGSTLGALAVQERPDLFHAYVGAGQMVDQLETDLRLYRQALEFIEETGDPQMEAAIEAMGAPPYEQISGNALDLSAQVDRLAPSYTPPPAYQERGSGLGPMGVLAPEYGLIDKVNVLRGLFDSFAIFYPRVQGEIDLRVLAPELDVPVYVIEGDHEHPARYDLAVEWFDALDAPSKQLFTVDAAGHPVVFERFDETKRILTTIVLPETYPEN